MHAFSVLGSSTPILHRNHRHQPSKIGVRAGQPAAERLLGSEVEAIEHYGTYSCRRMYGRETGRWSKHATAEAIDIAAFRLADGRRISLLDDWDEGGQSAAFLRVIRNEGCRVFGTLLGPDYNEAHRDHFHMQAGGFGTCR